MATPISSTAKAHQHQHQDWLSYSARDTHTHTHTHIHTHTHTHTNTDWRSLWSVRWKCADDASWLFVCLRFGFPAAVTPPPTTAGSLWLIGVNTRHKHTKEYPRGETGGGGKGLGGAKKRKRAPGGGRARDSYAMAAWKKDHQLRIPSWMISSSSRTEWSMRESQIISRNENM